MCITEAVRIDLADDQALMVDHKVNLHGQMIEVNHVAAIHQSLLLAGIECKDSYNGVVDCQVVFSRDPKTQDGAEDCNG